MEEIHWMKKRMMEKPSYKEQTEKYLKESLEKVLEKKHLRYYFKQELNETKNPEDVGFLIAVHVVIDFTCHISDKKSQKWLETAEKVWDEIGIDRIISIVKNRLGEKLERLELK
jgi:hypothetical protein